MLPRLTAHDAETLKALVKDVLTMPPTKRMPSGISVAILNFSKLKWKTFH